MHRSHQAHVLAVALVVETVASTWLAGCGSEDRFHRHAVFGTVSFKGQPLKHGSIEFQPSLHGPSIGAAAPVVNGHYKISQHEGLVPGKYRVLIFAAHTAPALVRTETPGDSPSVTPAHDPIPAKYNVDSQIVIEVMQDARNQFDFDLKEF